MGRASLHHEPLLPLAPPLSPIPPSLQPRRRVRRLKKSITSPIDASTLGLALPAKAHLFDGPSSRLAASGPSTVRQGMTTLPLSSMAHRGTTVTASSVPSITPTPHLTSAHHIPSLPHTELPPTSSYSSFSADSNIELPKAERENHKRSVGLHGHGHRRHRSSLRQPFASLPTNTHSRSLSSSKKLDLLKGGKGRGARIVKAFGGETLRTPTKQDGAVKAIVQMEDEVGQFEDSPEEGEHLGGRQLPKAAVDEVVQAEDDSGQTLQAKRALSRTGPRIPKTFVETVVEAEDQTSRTLQSRKLSSFEAPRLPKSFVETVVEAEDQAGHALQSKRISAFKAPRIPKAFVDSIVEVEDNSSQTFKKVERATLSMSPKVSKDSVKPVVDGEDSVGQVLASENASPFPAPKVPKHLVQTIIHTEDKLGQFDDSELASPFASPEFPKRTKSPRLPALSPLSQSHSDFSHDEHNLASLDVAVDSTFGQGLGLGIMPESLSDLTHHRLESLHRRTGSVDSAAASVDEDDEDDMSEYMNLAVATELHDGMPLPGLSSPYFDDPPSVALPSTATLSDFMHSLPTMSTSLPSPIQSAKRLSSMSSRRGSKRIYPRPPSLDIGSMPLRYEYEPDSTLPADFHTVSETPDLSTLPGAFIASPVLPTTFPARSPASAANARFARVRRSPFVGGPLSPAASLPPSTTFPTNCTTSTAALSPLITQGVVNASMPSSPMGTPTLAAVNTFGTAADVESNVSAPSTPIPDTHFTTQPMPAATTSSNAMQPALFDAAIASTIIGAVVCLGAVGYLAYVFVRRRVPKTIETNKGGTFSFDGGDEKEGGRLGPDNAVPRAPPLARLSFQRSPDTHGEDSFRAADFDQWVDCSETLGGHSRQPTEDHGGYPSGIRRSSSRYSERARSPSRLSRASVETSYSQQFERRRSANRTSTPGSYADSTFSRNSVQSSRTSHGVSSTPPRIPSPVGLRYSGDASLTFTTPPETPTKQQRRGTQTEEAPPVPELPLERLKLYSSRPSSPIPSRSRSSSKSSVSSKSTKSARAQLKNRSNTVAEGKPMPKVESPSEERVRKLQKRRATLDGAFADDSVQALYFQAQLAVAAAEAQEGSSGETPEEDPFSASVDNKLSDRHSLPQGIASSPTPSLKSSLKKKPRPSTMPAIVVSDHPQELVPPPTPQKVRQPSAEGSLDARFSMKTYDTVPWLSNSPSSGSALLSHFPRDDCSILDPDMKARRHFSVESSQTQADSFIGRYSVDSTILKEMPQMLTEELRPAKSDDDERSATSFEPSSEMDTEDEQLFRSQRRRTLLYSVYQQLGLTSDSSGSASTTSAETDGESGIAESKALTKRQSLVLSFPSPPTPTLSSFDNVADQFTPKQGTVTVSPDDAQVEMAEGSMGASREKSVASIFYSADESEAGSPRNTVPTLPPPRPPKSAWRSSIIIEDSDTDQSTTSTTYGRVSPLLARQPVSSRLTHPRSTPFVLPAGHPGRSFAADLLASVGSSPSEYDSEILEIHVSQQNSAHEYRTITDSLYSSQSASIESLSEAAIARAETVQVGRASTCIADLSGIHRFESSFGDGKRGAMGYESDESAYADDDERPPFSPEAEEYMSTVSEQEEY